MKAIAAMVFALGLAGCIGAGSLRHWVGHDEGWLIWKEGPAPVDEVVGALVPGEPTSGPMLDAIQGRVPTYRGNVRHLQWTTLACDYHAYLIKTNAAWVVVDAFRSSRRR